MKIVHGLISGDSHAQLHRDAFTSRMSAKKWGDYIPRVVETRDKSHMTEPVDRAVERWMVNGQVIEKRGVANCPAIMTDPMRAYHPQRWDEVPVSVYDPLERLKVLDQDGVDAEVLFPNPPVQSASFLQGDAAYEIACVRAYNDALAEWRQASNRYIPLALIPYLSDVKVAVAELERAVKIGHGGVLMLAEPNRMLQGKENVFGLTGVATTTRSVPSIHDPYWDPFWAACQSLGVAVHWHATGGIGLLPPRWEKYNRAQETVTLLPCGLSVLSQYLPGLLFSGKLERFPRLKWVCSETGIAWFPYVLDACDHEWERRHLWTEGLSMRPSDVFRRQMLVCFWFEKIGVGLRHAIGVDNIMWESDFPHNTSTYPRSRKMIEESMTGVSDVERRQMLYGNAVNLYNLN